MGILNFPVAQLTLTQLHDEASCVDCPHREQANQVKRSLLEQIQSHRFQEWDRDPETHRYDSEWPPQLPFFSPDLDSRNHKPTGVCVVTEASG